MFLLTKNQLEQIRKYIATYGIRTTDFPDAATVTTDDYLSIVQGGLNKKVKISELLNDTILPSLVVDITIADNLTTEDATKALSAKQGVVLKNMIAASVVEVVNNLTDGGTTNALSAEMGKDLKGMIDSLVVDNLYTYDSTKALSAKQGATMWNHIQTMLNGGTTGQVLTKLSDDNNDYGWRTPSGGGSGTVSNWGDIGGTLSEQTDLWAELQKKYEKPVSGIPASDIASGVIPTVPTISTSITTDYLDDTKTASPKAVYDYVTDVINNLDPGQGGGYGYIGNTLSTAAANPYKLLGGLGSVEILGMNSASGNKKIYFGDSTATGSSAAPYIEWDATNSCFHFSHGLYSDDFVTAGGYNGAGGGGGGASHLYDLTDVNKIGTAVGRADGVTAAQNNDVLTYSSSLGKWVAAPAQGGSGGPAVWGGITGTIGDQTDLMNLLSGYLTTSAASNMYATISSIPAAPGTLNTNNATAQSVSSSEALSGTVKLHKVSKTGSYADLLNRPTFYTLTLGSNGVSNRTYNPTSANHTFDMTDLTNVIGAGDGAYVQIGQIKLVYESSTESLKCINIQSNTNANFYATGNVAAGVASS